MLDEFAPTVSKALKTPERLPRDDLRRLRAAGDEKTHSTIPKKKKMTATASPGHCDTIKGPATETAVITGSTPVAANIATTDPVPALCAEWFRRKDVYEARYDAEYLPIDRKWIAATDPAEKAALDAASDEVHGRLHVLIEDMDDLQQQIEETRVQTLSGLAAKLRIAAFHGDDHRGDYERCSSMVISASLDAEALVAGKGDMTSAPRHTTVPTVRLSIPEPVIVLYRAFLAMQEQIVRLDDPDNPEMEEAVHLRGCLAKKIAETQSVTIDGVLAKLAVAATYCREENSQRLEIEEKVTISAQSDSERLLGTESFGYERPASSHSITQLYAEAEAIRNTEWPEDDAAGQLFSNRLMATEITLVKSPARTIADLLLKARLVAREEDEGPLTGLLPQHGMDFLVRDLEAMASSAVDPVLVLCEQWLASQAEVTRLNVKGRSLPEEDRQAIKAHDAAMSRAVDERFLLSRRIAETQAHTVAGLKAKLSVAATLIREDILQEAWNIEHQLAVSTDADAERLLTVARS